MKKRARQQCTAQSKELVSAALEILPAGDLRASLTLSHNIGEALADFAVSQQGLTFMQNIFTAVGGRVYKREDFVGDKPVKGARS
jgi:hypothetical protein